MDVADLGMKDVAVSDIMFAQQSIQSQHFQCGLTLRDYIDDLRRGKLDPWDLPDPLTLVDWPGRGFITLDHRRAWCLKQYEVGVGRVVCTRARVFRLPANTDQPVNKRPFRVFLRNHDGIAPRSQVILQ